ncbi:MAG: fibronectin type III domain-containing protein [Thermoplasmata archaeon]
MRMCANVGSKQEYGKNKSELSRGNGWALLSIAQAHEKSPRYYFTYTSPKITSIIWTPSHQSNSDWYECAKIVWQTNAPASGSKVTIANKVVTATTSSDGKTHTAWVTGLSPSTTYSFTVSSVYSGVTLTATGSGKTRMRITGWGTYDIAYSNKVYFRIKWTTTETPIGNNKVKYTFSDGTSGEKDGQQYPNSVNTWFVDIQNVNREKMGINVGFTIYASSSAGEETRSGSGVAYKNSDYSVSFANLRDGLFDCEEILFSTSPYSVDTDKDGLVDGWRDLDGDHRYDENEVPGEIGNPGGSCYIFYENGKYYTIYSGSIFYECVLCFGYIPGSMKELPDPLIKDIYVEVDEMAPKYIYVQIGPFGFWVKVCDGHMIFPDTKKILVNYFASHNVRLHIDDGCLGGGGEKIPHEDTTKIGNIPYQGRFAQIRNHVFVYCLFCHDSNGHLGHASNNKITIGDANWHKSVPDLLLLLGPPGWAIYWFIKGDPPTCQAGIFMHELGHVLGLYPDELMGNGNGWGPPTHHSCMNYLYILHDTWYLESEWNTIFEHFPTYLNAGV